MNDNSKQQCCKQKFEFWRGYNTTQLYYLGETKSFGSEYSEYVTGSQMITMVCKKRI